MSKKVAGPLGIVSGPIMLSFMGDQREFLAGGSGNAVCDRDPWTKGQCMEMNQSLGNETIVVECDPPIML